MGQRVKGGQQRNVSQVWWYTTVTPGLRTIRSSRPSSTIYSVPGQTILSNSLSQKQSKRMGHPVLGGDGCCFLCLQPCVSYSPTSSDWLWKTPKRLYTSRFAMCERHHRQLEADGTGKGKEGACSTGVLFASCLPQGNSCVLSCQGLESLKLSKVNHSPFKPINGCSQVPVSRKGLANSNAQLSKESPKAAHPRCVPDCFNNTSAGCGGARL